MKKFTKIAIIVVAVFMGIGLFCVIGSFAMGLTWNSFSNMVKEGKFSFDAEDIGNVGIKFNTDQSQNILDNNQLQTETDKEYTEIKEKYNSLDIEFGYGVLEITYGDVEQIQIKQENVKKYKCYVDEGTLHIEGNLKANISIGNQEGKIVIVVPNNMVFDEVDFEIGVGQADVSGLIANKVDIELGAGEMNITKLDAKEVNVETGAGELYAEVVGKQTDYSYNLECGIGQLKIGDSTYSGLGTEQNISNPGAERFADIECGIGEIEIKFQEQ